MPFTTPSITSSTGPSGFGQTSNSNVFPTVPLGSQCMSAQNGSTISFGSSTPSSTIPIPCPIMRGGSSAGSTSSSTSAFGQSSNANVSAPTNDVTSMGVSGMTKDTSPFSGTSPFASAQHSNLLSYSTTPPLTIFGQSTGLFSSYPTNGGKTVSPSGPKATSPSSNIWGSSTAFITSSTSSSGFGQTSNSTVLFGSQCMSAQSSSTITFGSSTPSSTIPITCPIMWGGSSSGSTSSSTSAFGQSSNANLSAPTDGVTSMGVSGMAKPYSPFASAQHSNLFSYSNTPALTFPSPGLFQSYPFNGGKTVSPSGPKTTLPFSNIRGSSTDSKTDASAAKESKNQPKLQCDEMEKSVQLICEDVIRHQENMKSWIERYRSLELEKIEDTQTINQLREELAQVTKSKDAIIAEYLESPAFSKRLDEEHEKRLSQIFHPCYVKALHTVQTKLPKKSKRRIKNQYAWHHADQVTKKEQENEKTSSI